MADLSIYELQDAILGALEEHENNISRSGNASLEIQKEVNSNIKKIIHSLNQSEKNRTAENKELAKRIETAIKTSNQGGGRDNNATNAAINNMDSKFSRFLSSASKIFSKASTIFNGFNQLHAQSMAATELVSKTLRSMDASGINQSYEGLQQSIRDSVVSLEQITTTSKHFSQTFAILNKQTGNAAKTFATLATNASEYSNTNNIAMTTDEISKYTAEYLESQRKMGGLDRLNQKQQQDGINSVLKTVEEVSKLWGVSREAMSSQGNQIDNNLKAFLYATGQGDQSKELDAALQGLLTAGHSTNTVEAIKALITGRGSIADPRIAKTLTEAGLYDAFVSGEMGSAFRSGNVSQIIKTLNSQSAWQPVLEAAEKQMDMLGPNAGVVQSVTGGGFSGAVDTIAAIRGMGQKTEKEDSILVNEQEKFNALQKVANEQIYILSKSVQGYEAYLKTMTTATEGIHKILSAGGDIKNAVNNSAPWLSTAMGVLGGVADIVTIASGLGGFSKLSGVIGGISRIGKATGRTIGKIGSKIGGTVSKIGRSGAKTASKTATKTAEKTAEKAVGKSVGKAATKGIGKSLVKKIPLVGALAGLGFAASRLANGDFLGAGGELLSGLTSLIPGMGTVASAAIDGALMARDMKNASDESKSPEEKIEEPDNSVKQSDVSEQNQTESVSQLKNQTQLLESILASQNSMNQLLSKGLINNM